MVQTRQQHLIDLTEQHVNLTTVVAQHHQQHVDLTTVVAQNHEQNHDNTSTSLLSWLKTMNKTMNNTSTSLLL